jgi:NitT/TauT family transport system substrate-binding protein
VAKLDAANGIHLALLEGGSGTPTVQMLANGQADFAVVSAEEILISNERNPKNPVVALFAVFKTNPQMIMCHAEKNFKNLAQVFSASVTLSWQSGLTYARFLQNKYPQAKVKTVPYQGGISTFLANPDFCQQGFITSEPLAAEKAGAHVSTFLVASEGFNPYTSVLAARAETVKAHPELVHKLVETVRAGWKDYVKNPAQTNARMHELNKAMDVETFAKSAAAQKDLIDPDGKMTLARWQELARTLEQLKVIHSAKPGAAFQ